MKVKQYRTKIRASGGQVTPSEPSSPVDDPGGTARNPGLMLPLSSIRYATDDVVVSSIDRLDVEPPSGAPQSALYPFNQALHAAGYLTVEIPPAVTSSVSLGQASFSVSAPEKEPLPPSPEFPSSLPASAASFSPLSYQSIASVPLYSAAPQYLPVIPSAQPPLYSQLAGPSSANTLSGARSHPSPVYGSTVGTSSSNAVPDAGPRKVMLRLHDDEDSSAILDTSLLTLATHPAAHYTPGVASSAPSFPIGFTPPPGIYDWSRYLPSDVRGALDFTQHDAALGAYFSHVACWQTPVVRLLFFADMYRALWPSSDAHTLHYSPGLHCAILAFSGALVSTGWLLSRPEIRASLVRAAREFIDADCQQNIHTLPNILALTVLAQYYLGAERGARMAYWLIGQAGLLAITAGLDAEPGPEQESLERRWCYVSLFNQSVEIAMHAGQEVIIPPPAKEAPSQVGPTFDRDTALAKIMTSDSFVCTSQLFAELFRARRSAEGRGLRFTATDLLRSPSYLGVPDAQALMLSAAAAWAELMHHYPTRLGHSRDIYNAAMSRLLHAVSAFGSTFSDSSSTPVGMVHMAFAGGLAASERLASAAPGSVNAHSEATQLAYMAYLFLRGAQKVWPCAQTFADVLLARIREIQQPLPPGYEDQFNGIYARPAAEGMTLDPAFSEISNTVVFSSSSEYAHLGLATFVSANPALLVQRPPSIRARDEESFSRSAQTNPPPHAYLRPFNPAW
ncbi:hypothetical protein AURDEDRAFT_125068 [Auricularia subglabra TFB-10046 SS5]|nr:hypothetical protein AURDEDRAFT_125068 [Auricularia subglabra TFB-10046 SS5]